MFPVQIYNMFKWLYPINEDEIEDWYPNRADSVRVRTKAYEDLIFTYKSDSDWKIETVDAFMDRVYGGEK